VVILVAWFYLLPYVILMFSPFSWTEADINKNGFVSPTEADYYASYGERQVTENGKSCTEYYALKDGLPLKKECE
jgi:hypothetical protein